LLIQVAIVTGGNRGIGYETTLHLALHKAKVYVATRSPPKAADAISKIKAIDPSAEVYFLPLDLSNLESVRNAADRILMDEKKVDILVCNAAVISQEYILEDNGIERDFQINYFGE
jgi:NAD(P)-dependent dehydrogenase (short-subunit alcohol dehydrogenase family)